MRSATQMRQALARGSRPRASAGGLPGCAGPARDRVVRGVSACSKSKLFRLSTPSPPRSAIERAVGRHLPPMGHSGRFDGTASSEGGYANPVSLASPDPRESRASNAVWSTAAIAGVLAAHTRHLRRRGRPALDTEPRTTGTGHDNHAGIFPSSIRTRSDPSAVRPARGIAPRPQRHPDVCRAPPG